MSSFRGNLEQVGWYHPLKHVWGSQELKNMSRYIQQRRLQTNVFPQATEVFNALLLTPFDEVRVVILGQDPYHTPGLANGLAFAVKNGSKKPHSLRNIFTEVSFDIGIDMTSAQTDLTGWASQGVLLLNTYLTVESGKPASHANIGWQFVTDEIIKVIAKRQQKQVFMLWGEHAKQKLPLIPRNRYNNIMCAAHPSAMLAKGFFGQRHFSSANQFLGQPIDWSKTSLSEASLNDIIFGTEP